MLPLSAVLEVVQPAFASTGYTEVVIGKLGISVQSFHSTLKVSTARLSLIDLAVPQDLIHQVDVVRSSAQTESHPEFDSFDP